MSNSDYEALMATEDEMESDGELEGWWGSWNVLEPSAPQNKAYTYLTQPQLLPNPRVDTPWQRLWASQSDPAYITTTGSQVAQ